MSKTIDCIVQKFHEETKKPNHRFKSWEHCYNFFKDREGLRKNKGLIKYACLHLGFYLASWGMMRGSTFLLRKDYLIHKAAVREILKPKYDSLRDLDIYEDDIDINKKIGNIDELYNSLKKHYKKHTHKKNSAATDTLITKILLGTLGCTPAYDRYFVIGIRDKEARRNKNPIGYSPESNNGLKKSITNLINWCHHDDNKIVIQKIRKKYKGKYPAMKIVDMYFWKYGEKIDKKRKN